MLCIKLFSPPLRIGVSSRCTQKLDHANVYLLGVDNSPLTQQCALRTSDHIIGIDDDI